MVFAIAHIRDGSELGKAWRDDGRMLKKKKLLTDFVACASSRSAGDNLLLFKVNVAAGHGGSSGRYDNLREDAFTCAFVLTQLGAEKVGGATGSQ